MSPILTKRLWPSVTAVKMATIDWMQWCNTRRLHEKLDYRTPAEVKAAYAPADGRSRGGLRTEPNSGRFRDRAIPVVGPAWSPLD